MKADLLIRSGRVLDAAHERDGIFDIAVYAGKVIAVALEIHMDAAQVILAQGKLITPGLVDTHVHLCPRTNGQVAHKMLARAGVTTALELAGPVKDVLNVAGTYGAGLTIACLELLAPDENISEHADTADIDNALDKVLGAGAIGVKMHYDAALSPEVKARIIKATNERFLYVASHCGSTATDSDLTGLCEDIEIVGKHRLHLAHLNSYCRGFQEDATLEALEAVNLLRNAPHLYSEAYLATINGTSGQCANGVPVNARVKQWLLAGGFEATETGYAEAIRVGYTRVHAPTPDNVTLLTGDEGIKFWQAAKTHTGMSFPVNPALSRTLLASSKDANGRFDVDAIATDGGGIPRNDMASSGWKLVELELLSPLEWVQKISWTPARVLGLKDKGHLGEGADADIALFDPTQKKVTTTIARGETIMQDGLVVGSGSRVLTTVKGKEAVRAAGCEPMLHDLSNAGFFTGEGLKA
jgi:cytosine/adenosine deaminase-related metal-dependent hydrolase